LGAKFCCEERFVEIFRVQEALWRDIYPWHTTILGSFITIPSSLMNRSRQRHPLPPWKYIYFPRRLGRYSKPSPHITLVYRPACDFNLGRESYELADVVACRRCNTNGNHRETISAIAHWSLILAISCSTKLGFHRKG
jgi:hypothetical protein